IPEPSRGSRPGRAATLTMRPPLAPPGPSSLRARIARIAAAEHRKDDSAFIWNWSAKSTAEVSATGDIAKPPARWIEPQRGGCEDNLDPPHDVVERHRRRAAAPRRLARQKWDMQKAAAQ